MENQDSDDNERKENTCNSEDASYPWWGAAVRRLMHREPRFTCMQVCLLLSEKAAPILTERASFLSTGIHPRFDRARRFLSKPTH